MKLTVSSTTMMKPLLHTENHPLYLSPPQRVVGLLEKGQAQLDQNNGPEKLVQYYRPDQQHALPQTAKWQDFLKLDNVKNISSTAVFGFEFDGTSAWYQVWNSTTSQICWLLQNNDMNYEPFAILAMDALVSLLPNWDGTLHQAPDSPNNPHYAACHKPETFDTKQIHNLLISDASTSAAGQLWFLATINSTRMECDTGSKIIPTRSGWISFTN